MGKKGQSSIIIFYQTNIWESKIPLGIFETQKIVASGFLEPEISETHTIDRTPYPLSIGDGGATPGGRRRNSLDRSWRKELKSPRENIAPPNC
jgi:hypothetical protein